MKHQIKLLLLMMVFLAGVKKNTEAQGSVKYKCMVQMNNYLGPAAYIAVYLVDKDNVYQKTLYVIGEDAKWYPDLKKWHKAFNNKKTNISTITGASISGGDRSVVTLDVDPSKFGTGYKIVFESAVEGKDYHQIDAEVALTPEGLAAKTEGKGYIRYVRFSTK